MRFADLTRSTRSCTLPRPTDRTNLLLAAGQRLLLAARPLIADRGLTLVGISVSGLTDTRTAQLELPFDDRDPAALDRAVDQVRRRFGGVALTRAGLLGQLPGPSMPMLPD